MLQVLEQIAIVKSGELERIRELAASTTLSDTRTTSWITEWQDVLTSTEHIIHEWRELLEEQTLTGKIEAAFAQFKKEAEAQSNALAQQIAKYEAEAEMHQPAKDNEKSQEDTQEDSDEQEEEAEEETEPMHESYFERQEPVMTGEGAWSDPLIMNGPLDEEAFRSVPVGGHTLPPLPYAYNALEPHIDEETMRIHHDKHHQSYVDGLNKAEKKMAEARRKGDFDLIKHWEREAAFNGAGHYLHTIFWNVMGPGAGGKPGSPLLAQINKDFGGYEAFKKHFTNAAEKVEGGGWAILVWSPRSQRLEILQAEKHQNLTQWDVIPLLVLDVWEHAYYLKHKNKRADYIDAWWHTVNWPHVQERFEKASKLKWAPY